MEEEAKGQRELISGASRSVRVDSYCSVELRGSPQPILHNNNT